MKHLPAYNEARRTAADRYDEMLRDVPGLKLPFRATYSQHVFHQYTLLVEAGRTTRDQLKEFMGKQGIPTMIYYPLAIHQQKAYQTYAPGATELALSERLTEQVISLPMHSELDGEQQQYITDHLRRAN